MRWFDTSDSGFEAAFSAFLDERRGQPADVDAAAGEIIEAVRTGGLPTLLDLARRFDKVELTEDTIRVSADEIAQGAAACPAEVREAIKLAAARIRAYHARQRPQDARFTDEVGTELGWRWTPLEAVGVYVPGGRAAYPSTVLMNAVPAAVAGVGRIAMVTPPGRMSPAVLAAAQEAGVTEIWRVGGAQACAALAYGAGPIQPVDKIVGPGNAYVTAAKRRLYGVVGIDALAGPSEIVVVADNRNDPAWMAADLLSQAEHDPAAQSILITDDRAFAEKVVAEVEVQLKVLATGEDATLSWRDHGAVIIAPLAQSPGLVDRIAPEHVEFALDEPEQLADQVRHAGAIFLGRLTPEAIGDYVAGSNHVLPTSRAARFSSGLSIYDFIKRTSLVKCSPAAFAALGPATVALAEAEGLPRPRPLGGHKACGQMTGGGTSHRLRSVVLDEASLAPATKAVEHERLVAISDLIEENYFRPAGAESGPYDLAIALVEQRLALDVQGPNYAKRHLLSLTPLKPIIRDYFLICESYDEALRTASPGQIEGVDMGRRGLHNEGSELLRERLAGKVETDLDTARRLFTLICALHRRT